MTHEYRGPDPAEQFKGAVRHYKTLIVAAMEEGFTREEAIELLKVYGLFSIDSEMMGRSY